MQGSVIGDIKAWYDTVQSLLVLYNWMCGPCKEQLREVVFHEQYCVVFIEW